MNGLLFITHQTESYSYLQSIKIALQGGCRQIQLRMKDATPEEVERVGRLALELCAPCRAALYIDDHVAVCRRLKATGVHLGKQDMPADEARKLLGNGFVIGGTANTFDDVLHLQQKKVDYIGLGPFRFTGTKKNLSPTLGLSGYQRVMEQCRAAGIHLPVLAIGGITVVDIPEILRTGVSGIALSSAILAATDPVTETGKILKAINKTFINC
jgi:thiamine-phosphate pyrophosphorylase